MPEPIKWVEVNERMRRYVFAEGVAVRFDNVTRIEVRESGKHRIETKDGTKAFVNTGWLWLEIDTDAWTF